MAVAAPERTGTAPPGVRPWWGDGAAPLELWPGVTIDFEATWNDKIGRWETHDGAYYFDPQAADTAVSFFPDLLKHHIGEFADQPFHLLDYQKKLLTRPLFGWKRASDGTRRFRKVFAFLPKGAGKSPWGAGTGIYLARCDGEAAAEVYAVANDRQQARTVHDNAKLMVERSPLLKRGCQILKNSIYWTSSLSTYQVLSSDASSAHGKRPHGVIFDELHGQKNRDLYEALKKSMIKRRQPVMIIITHAGVDDEGICFEEYEYAKGVLLGKVSDDSCLPVIFEMTSEDDWTDPAVHRRVNPGYGVTIKVDGIEIELKEAMTEPRKQNDFKRFHGNVWVNQATAWIPVEWWDDCKEPIPSDDVLRKAEAAIGIDMAQKIDLAAADVVFRLPLVNPKDALVVETKVEQEDGSVVKETRSLNYRIVILPVFWLPSETVRERAAKDGIRYDVMAEQDAPGGGKLLNVTDGAVIDSEAIVRHIKHPDKRKEPIDLVTRFPNLAQAEVGYDPAFATEIAIDLRDRCGFQTFEVLQNYKHLSEACQIFEALVKAKRVVHGGHRLLRWNLENVAIKTDDAGRIRPVKPRKATKRIDGIVAAIIALSLLIRSQRKPEFQFFVAGGGAKR